MSPDASVLQASKNLQSTSYARCSRLEISSNLFVVGREADAYAQLIAELLQEFQVLKYKVTASVHCQFRRSVIQQLLQALSSKTILQFQILIRVSRRAEEYRASKNLSTLFPNQVWSIDLNLDPFSPLSEIIMPLAWELGNVTIATAKSAASIGI